MACSARLKLIALLVFVGGGLTSRAQQCPKDNPVGPTFDSASRTLTGKVGYHDQIRQWFELVLDSPTCGQNAVQLLQFRDDGNVRALEVFRGYHVTADGP